MVRRRLQLVGLAALLSCAAVALIGCDPPNFATEADVLAVLAQPRTDAQQAEFVDTGRRLFIVESCKNCHVVEGPTHGAPRLRNLYTTRATLIDGTKIDRDRGYLVRSILNPREVVVAGYPQQMANYQYLEAEQVAALVAYLEQYSPLPSRAPDPDIGHKSDAELTADLSD
ncbi:MAG: cytochrome c [Planctomycetota bacterium]